MVGFQEFEYYNPARRSALSLLVSLQYVTDTILYRKA